MTGSPSADARSAGALRICLAGDVMTARGLDQALPHPGDPELHEGYVDSARDYLQLAERAHGDIRRPLPFAEIWGAAHEIWRRLSPAVRIMNLEAAITTSSAFTPKGINYRMHPANTPALQAARPDVLTLANNHVLDFGRRGLTDTLDALRTHGIGAAGAGRNLAEARSPAKVETPSGRLLVYALAAPDSGVPATWSASAERPGVAWTDLGAGEAARLVAQIRAERRPGDLAVVSIHWGSNWGYAVPAEHRRFAYTLIDSGEVALIHGHSSHHPRPIEIREDRLILYGCGDLLNDYEGIAGYETFRGDLVLLYFADLDPGSGALTSLRLAPLKIRRFRLTEPSAAEAAWMAETLARESRPLGVEVEVTQDGLLAARARA